MAPYSAEDWNGQPTNGGKGNCPGSIGAGQTGRLNP